MNNQPPQHASRFVILALVYLYLEFGASTGVLDFYPAYLFLPFTCTPCLLCNKHPRFSK